MKSTSMNVKVEVPVVMGGILNQKMEDVALPVDVTRNLKELGLYPGSKLDGRVAKLIEHAR